MTCQSPDVSSSTSQVCPTCRKDTQTPEGRCTNIECPRFNTIFSRMLNGFNMYDVETTAMQQSRVDRQRQIDANKSRRNMVNHCKCGRRISGTAESCAACARTSQEATA